MSKRTHERLVGLLKDQGGLIATLVSDSVDGVQSAPGPAQLASCGPRAEGHSGEYELLLEVIYEGYLLHYRTPRVLTVPENDLRLLAGDQLYALGLSHLVRLGDLAAVAELADVISITSLAHGAEDPDLARATWLAGAQAVGWGANESYRRAKELAFAKAPGAVDAMRTSFAA